MKNEIRYVVLGPGVRLARLCAYAGRAQRMRGGRLQFCLEVAANSQDLAFEGRVSSPQWFDEALVYLEEREARKAHRAARVEAIRRRSGIQSAAGALAREEQL